MKTLSLVLVSAVVAAGTSGGTVIALRSTSDDTSTPATITPARDANVARLEAQIAEQGELLRALSEQLEVQAPSSAERRSATELEDVVRSVLAEQLEAVASPGDGEPVLASAKKDPELTARSAFEAIFAARAAGKDWDSMDISWDQLRDEGLLDDVLAEFEEFASLNPDDPNAHVMLGGAYIQALQDASNQETARYAMKADGAFTRALELDDHNWEARFSKAVSLSFWPPLFGKQGEAIEHFEILLGQQADAPPQSHHAQTYVFLGNLYQQQGDQEKAKEIWATGLSAFPDDGDLLSKAE